MATFNYDYSFTPNTAAKATEVNGNFSKVKQFAEGLSTGVNIDAGAITTSKVADAAVTTAKLSNASVTTDKIVNSSVDFSKLISSVPRGVVAREIKTTNSNTGTLEAGFTGITFTPTVGRIYRVSTSVVLGSVMNDYTTTWRIYFGSSSGNVIQEIYNNSFAFYVSQTSIADSYLWVPSSATSSYINVYLQRLSGTDTGTFLGSSSVQRYLLIEDIGAA